LNDSTESYRGGSVFEFERAFKQQYPHLLLSTAGHWARQVELAELAHQLQVTSSAQRSSIEDVYVEGKGKVVPYSSEEFRRGVHLPLVSREPVAG